MLKKTLLLLIIIFTVLISGCASSGAYKMNNFAVPTIDKPDTIISVAISMAAPSHMNYKLLDNVLISEIDMKNLLNDAGIFTDAEEGYLAKVISPATLQWSQPTIAVISKYNFPPISINFVQDDDLGRVFELQYTIEEGTAKQIARALIAELTLYQSGQKTFVSFKYDLNGNRLSSLYLPINIDRIQNFGYIYKGTELNPTMISEINDNQWTSEIVKTKLGAPSETKILPDGSEIYVYYFQAYGRSKAHMVNPMGNFVKDKFRHTQILELRLVNGVVAEHGFDECKENCSELM